MNNTLTDTIIDELDLFIERDRYPDAVYLSERQIRKIQSEIAMNNGTIPDAEIPSMFMGLDIIVSLNDGPHFVSYE